MTAVELTHDAACIPPFVHRRYLDSLRPASTDRALARSDDYSDVEPLLNLLPVELFCVIGRYLSQSMSPCISLTRTSWNDPFYFRNFGLQVGDTIRSFLSACIIIHRSFGCDL